MENRKRVICISCNKDKEHFGLQMCSGCLRNHKRQTRPSFYLGTCYSEMSRRIKTYDKLRPNYYNLEKCTKNEFINKFLNDTDFLYLYKNWQNNNFLRKFAPSIDRINPNLGYTLDNIEFIRHGINSVKDKKIKIKLVNSITSEEHIFESCSLASNFIGISESLFCRHRKTNKNYKGYIIYEIP